jgi:excisionase family DNA binding protein
VAEFLGLSRATVYTLVRNGDLKHVRVANAIRIRPEDLDAFVVKGLSR